MSRDTYSRRRKAAAIAPMMLLSAVWFASGPTVATGEAGPAVPTLPDDPFSGPASVQRITEPGASTSVPGGLAEPVADLAGQGIPAVALGAYHRAESLMVTADPECHLSWTVVAAVGRVESDHGRFGGSTLGQDGVATPGIYGIALDGTHGTVRIDDTDGGRLDGDTELDRAVGPMQFIPSAWASSGVDADGDGKQDPQDVDDAAAAAGVYLCAGPGDLSSSDQLSRALLGYNHSDEYVRTVMALAQAYAAGDVNADVSVLALGTGSTVVDDVRPARRPVVPQSAGSKTGEVPGGRPPESGDVAVEGVPTKTPPTTPRTPLPPVAEPEPTPDPPVDGQTPVVEPEPADGEQCTVEPDVDQTTPPEDCVDPDPEALPVTEDEQPDPV